MRDPVRKLCQVSVVLLTLLTGGVVVTAAAAASPEAAPAGPCDNGQTGWMDSNGNWHWCNREEEPPETPDGSDPETPEDPENQNPDEGPETWCPPRHWITLGGYDSVPAHIRPFSWDEAPEGAIFQYDRCTCPASISYCPGGTTRWIPPGDPGEAFVLPLPGTVAEGAWAEIETTLERPDVHTYPGAEEPSVVGVPTFLAVDNWQGGIDEERCDATGSVCVRITATPTLTWDPGERGADTITCEDGGTRYEPAGGPVEQQAGAPGACAYEYRLRTGVARRRAEWPGVATITWEGSWTTASGSGGADSGTFEPVSLSTDVPRPVIDVSSVVVDD